ncbi:MAG: hypothetical protein MRY83_24495, partial [Flavobacteriales bacterium]|nr:hypothetical protein [Flavobacteriales bacterium]
MKRIILYIVLGFFLTNVFGQDDCGNSTNKKALGLYEKGLDRKKYDKKKRMEFLRASISEDENYLAPRLEIGKQIVRTSKYQGSTTAPATKHFLKIVEECPNYHSDPYFFLGEYYLEEEDYKNAAKYYEAYLAFESEDDSKFNRKWEEMEKLAKEDLKYAKFYVNVYDNPVPFDPSLVENVSSVKDEFLPLISPD